MPFGKAFETAIRRPSTTRLVSFARAASANKSPFAPPEDEAGPLSKKEELRQRQEAIGAMMREQTLREVEQATEARHGSDTPSLDEAVKNLVDNKGVGANYDLDREEWGGPKGAEPTRFGDWEVKGRISDF